MIINFINKKIYRHKLRKYVRNNLKKGHSLGDIKKKLHKKVKKKKYVNDLIDDVLHWKTEKRTLLFLLVFIFLIGTGYFYFNSNIEFRRSVGMSMPDQVYDFCSDMWWIKGETLLPDGNNLVDFRTFCYSLFGIQRQGYYYFVDKDKIIISDAVSSEGKECGMFYLGDNRDEDLGILEKSIITSINWYRVNNRSDIHSVYEKYNPGDRAIIHSAWEIVSTTFVEDQNGETSLGLILEQGHCI